MLALVSSYRALAIQGHYFWCLVNQTRGADAIDIIPGRDRGDFIITPASRCDRRETARLRASIYQQVTLAAPTRPTEGTASHPTSEMSIIGREMVLGPITGGARPESGANSVVKGLPAGGNMVGITARSTSRREESRRQFSDIWNAVQRIFDPRSEARALRRGVAIAQGVAELIAERMAQVGSRSGEQERDGKGRAAPDGTVTAIYGTADPERRDFSVPSSIGSSTLWAHGRGRTGKDLPSSSAPTRRFDGFREAQRGPEYKIEKRPSLRHNRGCGRIGERVICPRHEP